MTSIKKTGLGLLLMFVLALTGCEPEPNEIPDQDYRDDFVGTWIADDSPAKSTLNTYEVTISKDPNNSSQVILYNFHQSNESVSGLVTSNRINVTSALVNEETINGEGKLIGNNTIQWDYSVNDGADLIEWTATYTRK